MKKDDLIWTRKNNCYYICRVTENARDFMPGEREKTIENMQLLLHRRHSAAPGRIDREQDVSTADGRRR